jgi:indoleamine 2,3-dioxygenase
VYYKDVRPWIQGFNNVIYEGVEEYQGKPQSFRGETGAQSTLIPSLVAALSIKHEQNPLMDHLADMMNYMPPGHREFINLCWQEPSIREYVTEYRTRHPGLVEAFNTLIEGVYAFRAEHNRFQNPYIIDKIPEEQRGTGGTPFKEWLPKLHDETIAHKIKY